MSPTVKHAAVVYNPLTAALSAIRETVAVHERKHGWDPTRWYETSAADSGLSAAAAALQDAPAVLIVVGGDGTVRTVAEAVQGTGVPIALVPAGTGNLLARNLDVPRDDVRRCVASAFSGGTRDIDLAVAELEDEHGARRSHVFMVMAGIGLDADMAETTSALAKRRLGWFAYVTPIARSIIANRVFHLDYRIDGGRSTSTRAHTIIVGNCGTLTGSMLLMPAAIVDDGVLDVVMMRPGRRFGWAQIGTRLTLQGIAHRSRLGRRMLRGAPELGTLVYAQGRRFEARFDSPRGIELDGDGFGLVTRVRISVRPGELRICVAPPAEKG